MRFVRIVLFAAALSAVLPVAAAWAKPPLREQSSVDDMLLWIAIAKEIDDHCDSIKGRRLMAIRILYGLRDQANALGYSDAEIRAFVESDAEKARMRRRGEAYLAARGVTYAKPETFCALGRAEIARNSAIGVLLRAK